MYVSCIVSFPIYSEIFIENQEFSPTYIWRPVEGGPVGKFATILGLVKLD